MVQQVNNIRETILKEAMRQVCGHRVEDYGKPENSFQLIADLWNAYLGDKLTSPISAKDVTLMMCELKIARAKNDVKSDTYTDLAGYAACAGELAKRIVGDK